MKSGCTGSGDGTGAWTYGTGTIFVSMHFDPAAGIVEAAGTQNVTIGGLTHTIVATFKGAGVCDREGGTMQGELEFA